MARIELYAELLVNIRQITVFATLQSNAQHDTKAELSSDLKHIYLLHDGIAATIELPCRAADIGKLRLPTSNTRELSFRLPIGGSSLEDIDEALRGDSTIWSASDLSPKTQLGCRSCNNALLLDKGVSTWKDLPGENWAEMMDFWHCHKPDVEGAGKTVDGSTKGYGASNVLRPQAGTAFVGTQHLTLAMNDCTGIEVGAGPCRLRSEVLFNMGNKKEACLHHLMDRWHFRRYNYPTAISHKVLLCGARYPQLSSLTGY